MRSWMSGMGVLVAVLVMGPVASAQSTKDTYAFTVSMEKPSTHYFHVELRCEGMPGGIQEFKLPVWSPGYYMIMDYPKNIMNFKVLDAQGSKLPWQKTAKNGWQVDTAGTTAFTVSYDVYAFASSIAESSLDDGQAFISPTSLFMHPAGRLQHPVMVTLKPFHGWHRVSTGLDQVEGVKNTYVAPDFDVLYDSPILLGNQEVMTFDVMGIPHAFVGRDLGHFDRKRFMADLTRMVEGACSLMGEMPYRHYAFLALGPGGGGLEHLNSQVITFDGSQLQDPESYKRTMSFISHEYFHHFNVKRIRPKGLGPFDYDRENYTNLLWVSEGFTVYYEDLVLVRNGFYTPDEYFERIRSSILKFEEIPGHSYQSAKASSFDTWFGYFNHNEHQENTAISYYDKGLALAVLLDFKIRHETQNQKSLDDVMRTLYRTFYKEKGRGFTDAEFRQVCETMASCPLPEIFDRYVTTTCDLDYQTYFAYAGLEVDLTPRPISGGFLGADAQMQGGELVVSKVEIDSPAFRGGLSIKDVILAIDGTACTAPAFSAALKVHQPGDTVKFNISRRGKVQELELTLGQKMVRSFKIKPMASLNPLQEAIQKSWLNGR